MNKLSKALLVGLLEQENYITAFFGGGFKPPTKGHFRVVKQSLEQNPDIDKLYVVVGSGIRDGVSQDESYSIWNIYKKYLGDKVEVVKADSSPLKYIKDYIKTNTEHKSIILIGSREENDEDANDLQKRKTFFEKYGNHVVVKDVITAGGISGTKAREAAKISKEQFFQYLPTQLTNEEKNLIFSYIQSVIQEKSSMDEDISKSQLDDVESYADKLFAKLGIDVEFTRHFLDRLNDKRNGKPISVAELMGIFKRLHRKHGKPLSKTDFDFEAVVKDLRNDLNIPFAINITPEDIDLVAKTIMRKKDFKTSTPVIAINENASYSKDIDYKKHILELTKHMLDKGMNIKPLPKVIFNNGDVENAREFFGRTAYYNPNNNTIVLYTEGRHPKDIVRSFAHEMIHHIQNLEGRLENISTTNTHEDDHLNDIEAEANLKGTMTFRNWTDTLTENQMSMSDFNLIGDILRDKTKSKQIHDLLTQMFPKQKELLDYNYKNDSYAEFKRFIFNIDKFKLEGPVSINHTDLKLDPQVMKDREKKYQDYIDGKVDKYFRDTDSDPRKLDLSKMPPITIDNNGEVMDGNHRAFLAIKQQKPLKGYKIVDATNTHPNVEKILQIVGKKDQKLNEDGQKIAKKNMDDYKKSNNPSGKVKDPFGLNQFAREIAEETLGEADPKKGTGKKPKGSGRRLYTDEDPKDTVGIKFRTKEDIVDTLNKASFKAKPHARQSQIINLIHQRVRAAYQNAKDPDTKARLKRGLDYIEKRKESSKKKTQRLKKLKEQQLDKFGGDASPESQPKMSFEDRLEYYKNYYTNVSPSTFDIILEDGTIVIGGLDKPYPKDFNDVDDTRQVPVNENVPDAKDDGKAAPYGSGYEKVKERQTSGGRNRYRAIEKRGDKFYYIQDNPFSPGIRQEFGPYKTKEQAKKKMNSFPPSNNYRDIGEGDTYEKMAAKGKKAGSLKQGTVRKRLGIPKGEKIPLSLINKELARLRKMDKDPDKKGAQLGDKNRKYYKALQLAKTLKTTTNLNEGRYDTLTNQLSKIAFELFKSAHDRGDKKDDFEFRVDHPDEEHDIPSNEFYFDFEGNVEITDGEYFVDGGANTGFDNEGEEITPVLSIKFKIPKNPDWQRVSMDIKDVVRHELEHLTQDGDNLKSGKFLDDDQTIRDLIDLDLLPKADYFRLPKEIDAMLQGLYFKAKKSKRPYREVIDDYLATQPINTEEKENILKVWRSRAKALSLPLFEDKTMSEAENTNYVIYCDMDGVLVDFEKRFTKLSDGIPPREYESKNGKDKFWDLIDNVGGVGFWVGMPWMPSGKQLWEYISPNTPILLSSPSRSEKSRLGKRLWVRNNLPGTKLILANSYNKKNYAEENHILIDDRPSNVDQWRAAGGIGILFTSTNQTIQELKELGL